MCATWPFQVIEWRAQEFASAYSRASPRDAKDRCFLHFRTSSFRPSFYLRAQIPSLIISRGDRVHRSSDKRERERVKWRSGAVGIFVFHQRENVPDHLKYSFPSFSPPNTSLFLSVSGCYSFFHPPVSMWSRTNASILLSFVNISQSSCT